MSRQVDDERFDALVARHLDHTLDVAGRTELIARLGADPTRRRDYLRLLEQEELLTTGVREVLTPSARIDAARLRRTRRLPRPPRLPRLPRRGHRRSRLQAWTVRASWLVAALVLLVVGALALRPDLRPPSGIAVSGDVLVERAGAPTPERRLNHDDVVTALGPAQMTLADGGVVALSPMTRVVVRTAAVGLDLHLTRGEVDCDLPVQPRGFSVTTAEATTAVVGTRFRVGADAGATRVAVAHGRVRLRAADAQTLLVAGETAHVTSAGIRRAAHDAPARLADTGRWHAHGRFAAQVVAGGATMPPALPPDSGRDRWIGRGWTWHAPLPAAAAIAMQARFEFPAANDGIWHGEVFLAPPEAQRDAEEAQPSPCLRLALRTGIPTVVRRTTPDAEPEVLWTGTGLPPGPRLLRLELDAGTVTALIDGQVVWRGPLGFTTVTPGLRWARRSAGASPLVIDQVALESLLPR
ncbi:MAG: FecR domain-containing protein [Planctomycetes bacterium]|nr:FecR domain-containing protein [Planctomycetota bacterium]